MARFGGKGKLYGAKTYKSTYRRKGFRYNGIPGARRALKFAKGRFERKYNDTVVNNTVPIGGAASMGGVNYYETTYTPVTGLVKNGVNINERIGNVIFPKWVDIRYQLTAAKLAGTSADPEKSAQLIWGNTSNSGGTSAISTSGVREGGYCRTHYRLLLVQDIEGMNPTMILNPTDVLENIVSGTSLMAGKNIANLSRLRILSEKIVTLCAERPVATGKLWIPLRSQIRYDNAATGGTSSRHTNGIYLVYYAWVPDKTSANLASPEFHAHSRLCYTDA